MKTQTPSILVGVPVFEGWTMVGETLDSIARQDCTSFRVLMAVDGPDERSAEACAKYIGDPRFQLVQHRQRLGWAANTSWLVSQLREDYFCYWQQDDLCDPSYLRVLAEHAAAHPEASAIYADMQHFGGNTSLLVYPSVTGFALQRVLTQIEQNGPSPHRGLNRADAIRAALPLTQPGTWTAILAREGELHRVPQALYFRRVWEGSLSVRLGSSTPAELRERTLDFGLGAVRAALPLVPSSDHTRLLAFVADQLINHRPLRRFQYVAAEAGPQRPLELVADFLREAHTRHGVLAFAEGTGSQRRTLLTARRTGLPDDAIEALMIDAILRDGP